MIVFDLYLSLVYVENIVTVILTRKELKYQRNFLSVAAGIKILSWN